jgi:hypothetical protein
MSITSTSAAAIALAQVLGRNQGPTKLEYCNIDNFVLANGLRGNSSLKNLGVLISYKPEDGNRELLAIADALRENRVLVHSYIRYSFVMNDATWGAICDSLKAHPTLEVLDLRKIESRPSTVGS